MADGELLLEHCGELQLSLACEVGDGKHTRRGSLQRNGTSNGKMTRGTISKKILNFFFAIFEIIMFSIPAYTQTTKDVEAMFHSLFRSSFPLSRGTPETS